VYATGTQLLVANTLLASNGGVNCAVSAPPLIDAGHNLSFGDASCPATFLTRDPRLGQLRDNGGLTDTIGLRSGSAAIDQIPASGAGCPKTDERGVPRPAGRACDIGAYEIAPPAIANVRVLRVSPAGATVTFSATANAGGAVATLVSGTGATLGANGRSTQITGVTPQRLALTTPKLARHATYHFRIRVGSSDGVSMSRESTFSSNWPVISKLAISAGSTTGGATVAYLDSARAVSTLVVLRCGGPAAHVARSACARPTKIVTLRRGDIPGNNNLHLGARFAGHQLSAGDYELQVSPSLGILAGPTVSAPFKVA
jgi:hypothetical protein